MSVFPAAEKISSISEPLNWDAQKSQIFLEACREMATFHYERSPEIRFLYDKYHFEPQDLRAESDLLRIPSLGVTAMKYHLLTSLPAERAVLKLTSSGTRGQKTQIWFDQASLDRVQHMMDGYFRQEAWTSKTAQNYLVFNYDPDDAGDLGIAFTEKNQLRFAPTRSVFFTIKKDASGAWMFHKDRATELLKSYAADQEHPTRIFAMPAFLFEFIEHLKRRDLRFRLPAGSLIITGGGWKAAEDKKISREDFRNLCHEYLGIAPAQQRDAFGMAEHCAPYFECRHHRFHIAAYNRIHIRDPHTLRALDPGEVGLMELQTPFNAMMPTLSLLSTDYGRVHSSPCGCGWNSPTFEILGRAGIAKHKGCALTAAEIVRRT